MTRIDSKAGAMRRIATLFAPDRQAAARKFRKPVCISLDPRALNLALRLVETGPVGTAALLELAGVAHHRESLTGQRMAELRLDRPARLRIVTDQALNSEEEREAIFLAIAHAALQPLVFRTSDDATGIFRSGRISGIGTKEIARAAKLADRLLINQAALSRHIRAGVTERPVLADTFLVSEARMIRRLRATRLIGHTRPAA